MIATTPIACHFQWGMLAHFRNVSLSIELATIEKRARLVSHYSFFFPLPFFFSLFVGGFRYKSPLTSRKGIFE